ncbi:gamma-glutamylcyclotransferase-like [Convolutriloba macropyga]|uniref:gamma-glutamylcyclotransferase-like n=1 Tax=Convolutriloba macropyga TaxID=536237 RepID=UPI003F52705C
MSVVSVGDSDVLYFAFGSNLLAERLCQGSCPTVSYPESLVSIGKINGWRLAFGDIGSDPYWKGASATIKRQDTSTVYGAVWRIPASDLETLDLQEGVNLGIYDRVKSPDDIQILDPNNQPIDCYTYIMNEDADSLRPSPQYKHVIVSGAQQVGLPEDYIQGVLKNIEVNGNTTPVSISLSVLPNGVIP